MIIDPALLGTLRQTLDADQSRRSVRHRGTAGRRQPLHVVYGGAQLFRFDTPKKLGTVALRALETWAPDPASLADALGLELEVAARVYPRLRAKLEREPVEDYRVDFEDGYGHRSDAEEDADAARAGAEVGRAATEGTLPAFFGVRVKSLTPVLAPRALRTLEQFLSAAVGAGAKGPFLITIPKVVSVAQVQVAVKALDALERGLSLAPGSLKLELMVESAQGLVDAEGRAVLPQLHVAAAGRLFSAHFGAYDYTASLGMASSAQRLTAGPCDEARTLMQLAFAGTEVFLSDGATTTLPVAPHRGASLSASQQEENRRVVHHAWRLAADDIRHSLAQGFFQGWDLHPAQLVSRFGTVFAAFESHLAAAVERLENFWAQEGQATRVGAAFDDAATGAGLINFFVRGVATGAIDAQALPQMIRSKLASLG